MPDAARYLLTVDADALRAVVAGGPLTPAVRDALANARPVTPGSRVPRGDRLVTRLRPQLEGLRTSDHVCVPVPPTATHNQVAHCARDWARYRGVAVATRAARDGVHVFVVSRGAAP